MQTASIITAVGAIAAQGFGLLALWVRLRWRVRQEQVHGRWLVAIARALPNGGEVDERRPDGSSLTLSVPRVPENRGKHG